MEKLRRQTDSKEPLLHPGPEGRGKRWYHQSQGNQIYGLELEPRACCGRGQWEGAGARKEAWILHWAFAEWRQREGEIAWPLLSSCLWSSASNSQLATLNWKPVRKQENAILCNKEQSRERSEMALRTSKQMPQGQEAFWVGTPSTPTIYATVWGWETQSLRNLHRTCDSEVTLGTRGAPGVQRKLT